MSFNRMFAKARLRAPGDQNEYEAAYDAALKARMDSGDILWYKFEGVKLRLAKRTFLTIDFAVVAGDGILEFHDVKGSKAVVQEDAKAKMKFAAELFPFRFFLVTPEKTSRRDGRLTVFVWETVEI